MNLLDIIERELPSVASEGSSKVYIRPDISEKVLNNSIRAMKVQESPESVLGIVDTSLFHNGKTGLLFTSAHLYLHESVMDPICIDITDIKEANFSEITQNHNGKDKIIQSLTLKQSGQKDFTFPKDILAWIQGQDLAKLLTELIENTTSTNQQNTNSAPDAKIYSLEELPVEVKMSYLKILCNFAFQDDQIIDPAEYQSIISLAARLELKPEQQHALNNYLMNNKHIDSAKLLQTLESSTNDATQPILSKSLMKDVLGIFMKKPNESINDWQNSRYLCELAENLGLTTEQVNFLISGIQHDQQILDQRLNDTQIKKQTKDLAAKATAVGIPLAALYFSGSITGVSAAGITSGLAALGFGGILGFSGMVSGIGILILAGSATYQGVKKLTGRTDIENNKRREALLEQIIQNTQKTLNYLIDNVNDISNQLVDLTKTESINQVKIVKLTKLMAMLSGGAKSTSNNLDHYQSESILTGVPNKLDLERLSQLTKDPTTQKYHDIVINCYEANEEKQLILKNNISKEQAINLHAILDKIGYLSVKGVAKSGLGTATSVIKNAF